MVFIGGAMEYIVSESTNVHNRHVKIVGMEKWQMVEA